jgi:hypothetical protein
MARPTFDLVVPYCIIEGSEYTLLTDDEVADRSVAPDVFAERAEKLTVEDLVAAKLLKEGAGTEEDVVKAREQAARLNGAEARAELEQHAEALAACSEAGIVVERPTYTMEIPDPEKLAEARRAATNDAGRFDAPLFFSLVAKACFARCDRPGIELAKDLLPGTLDKLGRIASDRAQLGEARLSFALRRLANSRAQVSTATTGG